MSNLEAMFSLSSGHIKTTDDLNRTIEAIDTVLAATPPSHPNRAGLLNNLGYTLGLRFGRNKTIVDLNRAIEVLDMALAATPPNHPHQASLLNNLGNMCCTPLA